METNEAQIAALLGSFGIVMLILLVITLASLWKIFEKAGRPGWEALIPIYNIAILLKIVGKPVWWIILLIVPIVGIVFLIWTANMLSKSFGKAEGFTVGLVLLSFIFLPILAFGDAKYLGPVVDPAGQQVLA